MTTSTEEKSRPASTDGRRPRESESAGGATQSVADRVRAEVREAYGRVAESSGAPASCCAPSCCGGAASDADVAKLPRPRDVRETTVGLGYDPAELDAVPEAANLGLGCGNPTALAELKPGEVVVDLGAGAGLDALIAADKVGPSGRVIGVDMTPAMLARARRNAGTRGIEFMVEFREGTIEDLPVSSESADVVISNCVINLSPDKAQAFREAYRVLKPGGRLAVSDIVLTRLLPPDITESASAYIGCVAGAALEEDYFHAIEAAGFVDLRHTRVSAWPMIEPLLADPTVATVIAKIGDERIRDLEDAVWSYKITARKPF